MSANSANDSFMTDENKETLLAEIKKVGGRPCWASTVKTFMETFIFPGHQSDIELRIPAYQRDYAWTDREVNRLLTDLEKAATHSNETYHLGTIILHRKKEEGCKLNIIDGQQRLRTFELFAIVEGNVKEVTLARKERHSAEEATIEKVKQFCEKCKQTRAWNAIYETLLRGTLVFIVVDQEGAAFQLFATQNGLGAELSAENLLKAYHYHEMTHGACIGYAKGSSELDDRAKELEKQWEKTVAGTSSHPIEHPVLTSHLFFARRWARGEDKTEWCEEPGKRGKYVVGFDKDYHLGEYKGLTLGGEVTPIQNVYGLYSLLRERFQKGGLITKLLKKELAPRIIGDKQSQEHFLLDPFVSVCQPIINGKDFFEYACTYAELARRLFEEARSPSEDKNSPLYKFHKFYALYCNSEDSRGKFPLEVYETFMIMVADRFGMKGIDELHRPLWILAYYERLMKVSLQRARAGSTYGPVVCKLLVMKASLADVVQQVQAWATEAYNEISKTVAYEEFKETCETTWPVLTKYLKVLKKWKWLQKLERQVV